MLLLAVTEFKIWHPSNKFSWSLHQNFKCRREK